MFINIYDLNRDFLTANQVGKKLLNMGAFHAAVEVYGILARMPGVEESMYSDQVIQSSWKKMESRNEQASWLNKKN